MEWINVKDRLPEAGRRVILFQQVSEVRKVPVFGFYAPKRAVEYKGGDQWGLDADYVEADDKYYIPEGFYEQIENWDDIAFIAISKNDVTHWAYMPNLPIPEEL